MKSIQEQAEEIVDAVGDSLGIDTGANVFDTGQVECAVERVKKALRCLYLQELTCLRRQMDDYDLSEEER